MNINYIFPEIKLSDDGSNTLIHPILEDSYHSTRGAVGESIHIYIESGLNRLYLKKNKQVENINILEMGLGSGLNALLTIQWALSNNIRVDYTAFELYPIDLSVIEAMKYDKIVSSKAYDIFISMHKCEWSKRVVIDEYFSIFKVCQSITDNDFSSYDINLIDVVYYDAFAPDTQPELWTSDVFKNLYSIMSDESHLVTYSSKGIVKQALRDSGFIVKRLVGALGKRHMLLAEKN